MRDKSRFLAAYLHKCMYMSRHVEVYVIFIKNRRYKPVTSVFKFWQHTLSQFYSL